MDLLQDFMALLAYEEPEKSPMFHLLSSEHQQNVADNLNQAILGMPLLHSILTFLFVYFSLYDTVSTAIKPMRTSPVIPSWRGWCDKQQWSDSTCTRSLAR